MKTALIVAPAAFLMALAFNSLMAGAPLSQAATDSLPVAVVAGVVAALMFKRRMRQT